MLAEQGNRCLICEEELTKPCLDHVHDAEGKIRGILCSACNAMLGYAKDNPKILRAGARYLERQRLEVDPPIPSGSIAPNPNGGE